MLRPSAQRGRWALAVLLVAGVSPAAGAVAPVGVIATTPSIAMRAAVGSSGGTDVAVWTADQAVMAADRATGAARWSVPVTLPVRQDGISDLELASGGPGVAVAAWAGWDPTALRITTARHTPAGGWASPVTIAEYPRTPGAINDMDIDVASDGSAVIVHVNPSDAVIARLLPADGGAPGPERVLAPADGADIDRSVAVASTPGGGAIALWTGPQGIDAADLTSGAWSSADVIPGSSGGSDPAVAVTAAGEAVAAWIGGGTAWVASRPAGGTWSAPRRLGPANGGVAPIVRAAGATVAVSWPGAGRTPIAVRIRSGAWSLTTPPVFGQPVTVTPDGSVVLAGLTGGGVAAWSRLPAGASRWSPPVVVNTARQYAAAADEPLAITAAPGRPSLATGLWSASLRPGQAGFPDRIALRFANLDPAADPPFGALSRLRLMPPSTSAVPARALVRLGVRFPRYSGPVAARVQSLRAGRWTTAATVRADVNTPLEFRLDRPGPTRLRLAYGPGFRTVTNAVAIRITGTGRTRVVAGWRPVSLAVSGRALWVVSRTRQDNAPELRLLDGSTGRLRRGPIALGGPLGSAGVLGAGSGPVLLNRGDRYFVPRAGAPRLIGPEASVQPGRCAGVCTPTVVSVNGRASFPPYTTSAWDWPIQGPDGRVWSLGADPDAPYDLRLHLRLREQTPSGTIIDRGPLGGSDRHDAVRMVAVRGGLWVLIGTRLWSFGPSGPGVRRGSALGVASDGTCTWGLSPPTRRTTSRVVLLRSAAGPTVSADTGLRLYADPSSLGPAFAVGRDTAWIVDEGEQALVRVPLPAC